MGNSILKIIKCAELSETNSTDNGSKCFSTQILTNEENSNNFILQNPGTVEDIHKDCRDVLPQAYAGARVVLNKYLNNNFITSHIVNLLPNVSEGFYKFGVSYIGSSRNTSEGSFPIIFGEIEKNGTMDSNIVHFVNERIRIKFGAEYIGANLDCFHIGSDYFGETFSGSVGLANLNICENTGILCAQYLQSVSKHLALGSEIGWNLRNNAEQNKNLFNLVTQYKNEDSIFSTTFGSSCLCLSYVKKASSQLKIAAELHNDFRTSNNSFATIGYEIDIPKANLLFRASVDTKYNICSVLEKKLEPLPMAFSISTNLNHKSGKFTLGCGFIVS